MLTFVYTAKDTTTGEKVTAEVQAQSEQAAAKLLMSQNLVPIKIELKNAKGRMLRGRSGKVKAKDRVLYTRQLATLINAGLPLTQSLRTIGEQSSSRNLQIANSQIVGAVEGGTALAEAFAKYPKIFNNIYIQLIAAGEASGTLDEALERIATQQEKDAAVLAKIRGAMIYPAIVIVVILLVLVFMLTTVVPQIEVLYKDLKIELPFLTKVLVLSSKLLTDFWFLALPLLIAGIYFLRLYAKSEGGKIAFDKLKMRAPIFGPLFMKLYMARFCRTGSTLLAAGVPLLEMLRITAEAINNYHIQGAIMRAATKVKGGKALSESIADNPHFLSLVPQMIKIGEQSGAIDAMMAKTASYYENELDEQIKTISTVIEPVLMVILALMAGVVIGAILLPVYGLVGQSLSF
jgi:type IV pilus assembly protein PilC